MGDQGALKNMTENEGSRRVLPRRNERGIGTTAAVLILAGVVMVVGAVSYVVLSVEGPANTSSSSVHSCAPSKSPACADHAGIAGVSPSAGERLA